MRTMQTIRRMPMKARAWLVAATMVVASGCTHVPPQQAASDFKECAEMVAGGLRPLAAERDQRFNGKVGDEVARCRGGDKAAEFRKTPYVDWANYWATGDDTTFLAGTT